MINILSPQDMLNVWEQGLNQSLLQRVLIMLVAAYPEVAPGDLAQLSIGQRDERLLLLRERLFGPHFVNTVLCPACSERIEWENTVTDVLIPSSGTALPESNEFDLEIDQYSLRCRLPNSIDIAAVVGIHDVAKAQQQLLSRCIVNAKYAGDSCAIDKLPEQVKQSLTQGIEALDPQAEIRINLHCPECSHRWEVLFDIASFLWSELHEWAVRTLQTVHKLASSYGWTEREILNLSPVRRQLYLGMVSA